MTSEQLMKLQDELTTLRGQLLEIIDRNRNMARIWQGRR